jgi:hypothetical protein
MKGALKPEAAAATIPQGAGLMIGGFMAVGTPERMIDAIVARGVGGLTCDPALRIAFDAAMAGPLPDLWPLVDACEGLPLALIRGAASDVPSRSTVEEMRRRRPDLLFTEVPLRGNRRAFEPDRAGRHCTTHRGPPRQSPEGHRVAVVKGVLRQPLPPCGGFPAGGKALGRRDRGWAKETPPAVRHDPGLLKSRGWRCAFTLRSHIHSRPPPPSCPPPGPPPRERAS